MNNFNTRYYIIQINMSNPSFFPLDVIIAKYKDVFRDNPIYLVMAKGTFYQLNTSVDYHSFFHYLVINGETMKPVYQDIPIAFDDTLKLGEIKVV